MNSDTATDSTLRTVERVVTGRATQDGAGVRLTRLLDGSLQHRLDPFLMLDLFGSDRPDDYIAGFPDHPHRGFETITIMLEGRMRHRDSAGHEGLLGTGGVQWMTAGRGVIHSEIPEQVSGRMAGYQLWLNLPARDKMCEPDYRDYPAEAVPLYTDAGVQVRVVAGHSHGVAGAVQRPVTEPLVLDIRLAAGARFAQPLPPSHHAFVAVHDGELAIGGTSVHREQLAVLAEAPAAQAVELVAGPHGASALLVAGRPLHEPIAQYGPFVMNTREQLMQAVDDYRAGRMA